jgi:hypothetical protein
MCVGIEPYPYIGSGSFQAEKRTARIAGALPSLFSGEVASFIEDTLTTRAGASVNAFT